MKADQAVESLRTGLSGECPPLDWDRGAASTVVYVIPRTAVPGAILLRLPRRRNRRPRRTGEPFWIPVAVGGLVWLGLYLRDRTFAALIPFGSDCRPFMAVPALRKE